MPRDSAAIAISAAVGNPNIQVLGQRHHSKASEAYVDVVFEYPDEGITWTGSVPYQYRRAGLNIGDDSFTEIAAQVLVVYEAMQPESRRAWLAEETPHWDSRNAVVTREYFDGLSDNEWQCAGHQLPANPNFARRIQDLKDIGYTLAYERRYCSVCGATKSHLIMLALPRYGGITYETISPALKRRIIAVLESKDAYEARRSTHLLPDHKFPEIRWDSDTTDINEEAMSADSIRAKFQLLSNQHNQQKREVCRECFQTGTRGFPYGVEYYYEGNESWPSGVPETGKVAEAGCVGCGWYDLEEWRTRLNAVVVDL